tara:strand:- start:16479 stop:17003 length:525 start_codon:yes stop_codon:yes gene_type:complete
VDSNRDNGSKNKRNETVAKWVLAGTGFLPVVSAWVWYLVSLKENWKGSVELLSWLFGSTVVMILVSWAFRRRCFEWIYFKRPVFGSFVSILFHVIAGYLSLMATIIVYSMIVDAPSLMTWEKGMAILFYGLFVILPQLPGAAVGFYLNAHVLVRLSKGKWVQEVDVWKPLSKDI